MSRIGWIGLGNMGGALAGRLAPRGGLLVWDLRAEAIARVVALGATAARSVEALARECDIIVTCLPSSAEVQDVLFGAGDLAAALKPGSLVVDMTTGDPAATRALAARLQARVIDLVDAPVAGSIASAAAGTIAITLGGSDDACARCRPLLEAISPRLFRTGEVGTAQVMKLVANLVSAGTRAVLFEAVTMGIKNGLDLKTCAALLDKGNARSHATEVALPRIVAGDFAPTFTLGLMLKDVRLATGLGAESGVPMVVGDLVRALYEEAVAEYGAECDVNSFIRLFERRAGASFVPGTAAP